MILNAYSYPIMASYGFIFHLITGTHGAPREVPVLRAAVGVEDPREALALVDVMQFHQGLLGLSRKHLLGKVEVAGSGSWHHGQQNPWQNLQHLPYKNKIPKMANKIHGKI